MVFNVKRPEKCVDNLFLHLTGWISFLSLYGLIHISPEFENTALFLRLGDSWLRLYVRQL